MLQSYLRWTSLPITLSSESLSSSTINRSYSTVYSMLHVKKQMHILGGFFYKENSIFPAVFIDSAPLSNFLRVLPFVSRYYSNVEHGKASPWSRVLQKTAWNIPRSLMWEMWWKMCCVRFIRSAACVGPYLWRVQLRIILGKITCQLFSCNSSQLTVSL